MVWVSPYSWVHAGKNKLTYMSTQTANGMDT